MIAARGLMAACLAHGWAGSAAAYDELPRSLAKLSPEDVVGRIRIDDEMLEQHVVVSTQKAWHHGRRIEGAHVFEIPGEVVEVIAASYRLDSRVPWRPRFKNKNGGSITGGLAPAEVVGLLKACRTGAPRTSRL